MEPLAGEGGQLAGEGGQLAGEGGQLAGEGSQLAGEEGAFGPGAILELCAQLLWCELYDMKD